MDKESYNIDEILSEIKKRREEEPKEENTAKENDIINEEEEVSEEKAEIIRTDAEPSEEKTETPKKAEDEMVDILDITEEEIPAEEKIPDQESAKNSKKKKTKVIIAIIAAILAIAIAVAAIFANDMLNKLVNNNKETAATTEAMWTGMDKLVEDFSPIDETEASDLSSLQDMIKTWYYNGKPCSSTHVLNVMFIGEDTRGTEILDEGTRADSAIIVSINIDTEVITLTSVLRDAYTYWETTEGDESTGQFGKINGAMSTGDINAYINCVENMYKINIDNYAIVNFDSFETIVDTLGGVTLELTAAEINEINNHQKRYGNVTIEKTFEGNKGKLKLNGKQALAYCRIRKLDSDNMRADRQKTCISEIFKQTKDASTVKLLKIINNLIPYVKTSFSKNQIVKIAKYAFSQGWLDYDIYMQTLPEHNLKGGIAYGAWVWKCDFPADAYNLQYILYGKSSITLAHIRVNTAKCRETGFRSDGAAPVDATITNEHYGEATTVTTTKKDEETTE